MITVYKKIVSSTLALTVLFSAVFNIGFQALLGYAGFNESLTSLESQVIEQVKGTNAYNYDVELEKIALNITISSFSFRSGGSVGATATAMWLRDRLENFGLTASLESFEFPNWNLLSQPTLIIDDDGDNSTVNDQTLIESFQSEHFSWPTSEGGVFADLVVLPLPNAANIGDIGSNPINTTLWNATNTRDKIVLVGREVRWNSAWEETYYSKLSAQPPATVIYTWWYDWMSFAPPFFSSTGGRPPSNRGPYYWTLEIPVGWVNYEDGLLIRNRGSNSAKVTIHSIIGSGPHYNVVGRLQGHAELDKFVIVSGHYDTVMTAGFVDNGAGVAGVLELARGIADAAAKGVYKSTYTILFIAFASEELDLVGSSNYVRQHKAEMKDIIAVINLDSIGSDSLSVAPTNPSEGLDLDELILKAARDLNTDATLLEVGGSDHEVFRNPRGAGITYSWWWPSLDAGISDAAPVNSSTLLASYPLLYSDTWSSESAGWIHTSYDNSTSTQTLNWLEPSDLDEQIKVAALSVIRVSPSIEEPAKSFSFPWWTLGAAVVGMIVVGTVVYFFKVRKPPIQKNVKQ